MAGSRRIAGITIELGADTSKLTEQLKQVDKQLSSSASSLKDINKLLKLDPGNTTLLVQKQKELQTSIKGTKERLAELQKVTKDSVSPDEWDRVQREIVDTKQKLKTLEKEYKTFGSVAAQKLKAVGEKLKSLGTSITAAGKTMSTHLTAPIIAGFGAALKVTADFDAQMSKVAAISGATGDQLEALRDKARDMGATTKFSAQEAGEAMEYMAMAGWNTEEMLDGVQGVMYLAAAAGEDLGTTSDIVTDALTAFGKSAADASDFADVLAVASSKSNTNVSMMGETFKYVAPLAGALGYDYRDVAVAIGLMANSGIKASQAGTSLRGLLTNLSKESGEAASAMDQLGISLTNPDGSTKSLAELLGELREKFSTLTETEKAQYAAMLAGKNGMSGLLAIVNATDEEFAQLTTDINNSAGAAETMANTMNDNLSGQLTILKSTLSEIGIQFGEILMPYIRKFVAWIQNLASKFAALPEPVKEVIVVVGSLVAALGPLMIGVGTLISAGGHIATALAAIAPLIQPVITALSGPAGLAIAIGTVVAYLLKVTGAWDKIKAYVEENLPGILESAKQFLADLSANFGQILEDLKSGAALAWADIVTAVTNFGTSVKTAATNLQTTLATIWEDVTTGAAAAWESLKAGVTKFAEDLVAGVTNIKETLTGTWDNIKTGASESWDNIKTGLSEFLKWIRVTFFEAWGNVWRKVVDKFGSVFATIKDKVKTPINSVIDFLNDMIERVQNALNTVIGGINTKLTIQAPDFFNDALGFFGVGRLEWSPGIPEITWGRPIPRLASGGKVRNGGQAIVGEYAPEYLRVINGQAVVTPMQGGRWDRPSSGSTINNNITINQLPGESSEQLAQRVQRVLVRWEKESRAVFGT